MARQGGSSKKKATAGRPEAATDIAGVRVTAADAERAEERRLWTPTLETAVSLLVLPRMASALLNPIADCDETFNYWEPLHFLLHGFGFQTWEYSPVYALRSYLYLRLHSAVANATTFGMSLGLFGGADVAAGAKPMLFYALRGALGLACAYAEAHLYRSSIPVFGRRAARFLLWLLVFNAGLFHASTAFLPSSFVMYLMMLFLSAWMDRNHVLALFWGIVAVLCGWPYVGVLFVPFAVDMVSSRGVVTSVAAGVAIGSAVLALELSVNWHYYQRLVLPAWNIVKYNVLSSDKDSTLYGTEPWSFYALNLALNFNVAALLAVPGILAAVVALPAHYETPKLLRAAYLSPLYIWMLIMFLQPHKEERFLSPVYPLLCLAAAVTLSAVVYRIQRLVASYTRLAGVAAAGGSPAIKKVAVNLVVLGSLGVYVLLSCSRVASNVVNYGAPLRVYQHLQEHILPQHSSEPTNLCLLKEWYRFPASFFIPTNATRVQFVKSSFGGQLPKPFEQHQNATSIVPTHMNDLNQEEPSRYVPLSACDYVVDLDLDSQHETRFWEMPDEWMRVHFDWFLDAEASPSPYRSFYIPVLTPAKVKFARYSVYKRVAAAGDRESGEL
jgi:alpha-1,2-mannosyltransferase